MSRRSRRTALVGLALGLAVVGGPAALAASPAPKPPPPPSGIGSRAVFWMAVSPAFKSTGLVAALTAGGASSGSGQALWVSHDGGYSWAQSPATGWSGGRFTILADAAGKETMLAGSGSQLERSDDGGTTWTRAGDPGGPTAAPSYATDGTVAVAGAKDYVYHAGQPAQPVTGSGGAMKDQYFMYSPSFPSAGIYPPVLLTGGDPGNGLPRIQQCSADLTCTGNTTLAGAVTFSLPVTLYPSSTYVTDGVVFAQSGRGIYKSADGGRSFAPLTMGEAGAEATATNMLAVASGYSEGGSNKSAYAAVLQIYQDAAHPKDAHSSGGIYRTTDGGVTWSRIGSPSPLDKGATAVALAPDGRLFAAYLGMGSGQGLLCSSDKGSSWHASCSKVGTAAKTGSSGSASGRNTSAQTCTGSPCLNPSASAVAGAGSTSGGANGSAGAGGAGSAAGTGLTPARLASAAGSPLGIVGGGVLLLVLLGGGFGLWRWQPWKRAAGRGEPRPDPST
ncbi:MAG TPA: hypothetical protein VG245_03470 [Candidatus Dormibacteraeota bacterium]|nr:hypothetical protein [Candidatus Dormibacteraeota bacterium]